MNIIVTSTSAVERCASWECVLASCLSSCLQVSLSWARLEETSTSCTTGCTVSGTSFRTWSWYLSKTHFYWQPCVRYVGYASQQPSLLDLSDNMHKLATMPHADVCLVATSAKPNKLQATSLKQFVKLCMSTAGPVPQSHNKAELINSSILCLLQQSYLAWGRVLMHSLVSVPWHQ